MTQQTEPRFPQAPLHGEHNGREGQIYHPDAGLLAAANTALFLGTPLLLAGEPGCGKTDFAWYAAKALSRYSGQLNPNAAPLEIYVRSDMQARDLLYHYDALARFADAQCAPKDAQSRAHDPRHYIRLEGLGLALASAQQRVVLIDEIDKAPRDLPNDLLRELDQGRFTIPEIPKDLKGEVEDPNELGERILLRRKMERAQLKSSSHAEGFKPLVIITSNAERQLPDAFLRRCVFYFIRFPDRAQLLRIVRERFPDLGRPTAGTTADDIVTIAEELRAQPLVKRPGTAEILGWVRVMLRYGGEPPDRKIINIASAATALREANQRKADAANRQQRPRVDWVTIPRLHCLLKLHEDLTMLGCLPKL